MTDRLAELKRKLAARRGKPEYKDSVKMIEAEIERLARDQSGVTIIEYGLIGALIAVALVIALGDVGVGLQGVFESVSNNI